MEALICVKGGLHAMGRWSATSHRVWFVRSQGNPLRTTGSTINCRDADKVERLDPSRFPFAENMRFSPARTTKRLRAPLLQKHRLEVKPLHLGRHRYSKTRHDGSTGKHAIR